MNLENLHARGFAVSWPYDSGIELDTDIDAALNRLRLAFPGTCIWYGGYSGSLWALLPDRLIEAKNSAQLAHRLHAEFVRPGPAGRDGRGASAPAPPVPPPSPRSRTAPGPGRAVTRPSGRIRTADRPGLLARLKSACRRRLLGAEHPARHVRPTRRRSGLALGGRGRATPVHVE